MLKPKRTPKSKRAPNIRTEDDRLLATTKELVQLARQLAPKWNRLSNGCKLTIERDIAKNLHATNARLLASVSELEQDLDHLDYCRGVEPSPGEDLGKVFRRAGRR